LEKLGGHRIKHAIARRSLEVFEFPSGKMELSDVILHDTKGQSRGGFNPGESAGCWQGWGCRVGWSRRGQSETTSPSLDIEKKCVPSRRRGTIPRRTPFREGAAYSAEMEARILNHTLGGWQKETLKPPDRREEESLSRNREGKNWCSVRKGNCPGRRESAQGRGLPAETLMLKGA